MCADHPQVFGAVLLRRYHTLITAHLDVFTSNSTDTHLLGCLSWIWIFFGKICI